jgi:hypothetical protein
MWDDNAHEIITQYRKHMYLSILFGLVFFMRIGSKVTELYEKGSHVIDFPFKTIVKFEKIANQTDLSPSKRKAKQMRAVMKFLFSVDINGKTHYEKWVTSDTLINTHEEFLIFHPIMQGIASHYVPDSFIFRNDSCALASIDLSSISLTNDELNKMIIEELQDHTPAMFEKSNFGRLEAQLVKTIIVDNTAPVCKNIQTSMLALAYARFIKALGILVKTDTTTSTKKLSTNDKIKLKKQQQQQQTQQQQQQTLPKDYNDYLCVSDIDDSGADMDEYQTEILLMLSQGKLIISDFKDGPTTSFCHMMYHISCRLVEPIKISKWGDNRCLTMFHRRNENANKIDQDVRQVIINRCNIIKKHPERDFSEYVSIICDLLICKKESIGSDLFSMHWCHEIIFRHLFFIGKDKRQEEEEEECEAVKFAFDRLITAFNKNSDISKLTVEPHELKTVRQREKFDKMMNADVTELMKSFGDAIKNEILQLDEIIFSHNLPKGAYILLMQLTNQLKSGVPYTENVKITNTFGGDIKRLDFCIRYILFKVMMKNPEKDTAQTIKPIKKRVEYIQKRWVIPFVDYKIYT